MESPEMGQRPRRDWRSHPIVRHTQAIRDFGNEIALIRIKWLFASGLIFLISVIGTQWQFNGANNEARIKDREVNEAGRLQDAYIAAIINYNDTVNDYQFCVEAVNRSDLNREQHLVIVERLEELGFDEDAQILRNGPLLSAEPRTLDECVVPPPVPLAPTVQTPEQLDEVINNELVSTTTNQGDP